MAPAIKKAGIRLKITCSLAYIFNIARASKIGLWNLKLSKGKK